MSPRHMVAALIVGFALASAATSASATRQEPVRPGNGVSTPRLIKDVKPQYTPEAMKAKVQGSIELDVVVLASGDVGEVTVTKSLDPIHGLDEEAVKAASQWKFEPGRREDTPVPVLVTITMVFTLK